MATIVEGHLHERRHTPERRSGSRTARASRMNAVDWISMALLIVGGINWGLVGLFGFDLVATLFGEMSLLSRIVYAVVGLSALYTIYTSSKMSRS
ncbi:MAG TPA: DUF378 domain-containing protein [Noviherbaspirillum sp.]|uniref:DUF378 domain-containing protein n=1 Tax=Noviherbaspirillum sp. TaxID=1926288 RepID=UPI002D2F3272|nr:DUF378 domain-containing protein [Noviherbaspirillum sp.]HYD97232.1 DUF378 domain-containing protein [Noviherbaspirillum sp.]